MPEINVTVKCSNDTRLQVAFDPESTTVLQLKEKLEKQLEESGQPTPAPQQRLIYSGRVLKDDTTLSTYKVAEGHTIHLVRQTPKPATPAAPASTAYTAAPTSPSASATTETRDAPASTTTAPSVTPAQSAFGTPGADPLAAILGGTGGAGGFPFGSGGAGGAGGLPFGGGFGSGFGGLGAGGMPGMDPQRMNELMSNPAVLQGMSQLFSNPAIMDAIMQSNPQLSSMMTPEMRQMMQSEEFRRMMANPEVIRSAMTLGPMLNQMGLGPGAGAGAGSPFANPWGSAPATSPTSATPGTTGPATDGATPAANPAANPMFNPALLGALLGGGAPGALPGGFGSGGYGAAVLGGRQPEEVFEVQLRQLQEMGFYDAAENVRVLTMTGGNVEAALEILFSGPRR